MSTDLKAQARELATALEGKRQAANTAWTEFSKLRDSAKAEGVDFTKNEDAFNKLDDAGKKYDEIRDEIAAGERKYARLLELASDGAPEQPGEGKNDFPSTGDRGLDREIKEARDTFGDAFVKSDVYAELKSRGVLGMENVPVGSTGAVKVADRAEIKTLLTTSAGGSALFRADRLNMLVDIPQPPLNLLDVIPFGTTDSDTVEWVEESTFTNAAAETAEGTAASESTLAYTTKSTTVQEITHFIPATKKILADAGQLRSLIDGRMVYGVRNRLQNQIVNGNASGSNLRGILNTAGILTQARGTDSRADAVHKGITKIRVQGETEYVPTHVLIHPTDWETQILEKDAQGRYYFGGPAGGLSGANGGYTLWGLQPIITTQVAAGTPIVVDVNQLMLWIREGLSLAASDSHSTFFVERKVAILAALRAAFAVTAPKAVATITSF